MNETNITVWNIFKNCMEIINTCIHSYFLNIVLHTVQVHAHCDPLIAPVPAIVNSQKNLNGITG